MSSFSWLDYSEFDRQKALQLVRAFAEKGTVDELGIGTVRDAFSDLLFPGTSTLHTRARYLFFIPWIYRKLEAKEWGSAAEVAAEARKHEIALINGLAESDDRFGIIGIDARETLKNLPSALYWQGLSTLGLRLLEGSQASFHRRLAAVRRTQATSVVRTDDGDPVGHSRPVFWHSSIPDPSAGFPKEASFRLTPAEARFLQDRVRERAGASLFAWLLVEGKGAAEVDFPWEHPRADSFRSDHREQLRHARNLSDTMRGAPLLYNLMLAMLSEREDLIEGYKEGLDEWIRLVTDRANELSRWDRQAMWTLVLRQNPRVPLRTQDFISRWLDIACDPVVAAGVARNTKAKALIELRERALKGPQSRLANLHARERWGGESGTTPLDFRWGNVKRLVTDVLAAT
jgi:hypothetical protein